MGNAQLIDGDTVFLYRVAGVALDRGRVLVHRSEHDDFWALPGGRVEVGETATEALRREMWEEISVEVGVGGLIWVVENFFDHYRLDRPPDPSVVTAHHEVGFYLEMEVPTHLVETTAFDGKELAGTSREFRLEYRWFALAELASRDVRPARVGELLSQPIPMGVPTIVNRD